MFAARLSRTSRRSMACQPQMLAFEFFVRARRKADRASFLAMFAAWFLSDVATTVFLGGWHGPFLPGGYGVIWFLLKVGLLLFCYVWIRWTLPRYRYDQLMQFGWKVLLPLAVVNLLATAAVILYWSL